MKLKIFFPVLFFSLFTNFLFASFPVERTKPTSNSVENTSVNSTTLSDDKNEDSSLSAVMSNEKSQGIALVLALTLGLLAAHRWYLGTNPFVNIMFIISFGGLGIWLLVDIIRIATGGLNPTGRYKSTFF